jgi:hypothetical protein
MECTRFEELLFERLEGLLDETTCAELDAHAGNCPRCQALAVSLRDATATAGVPDDLAATVLALTSERAPLDRALRQLDLDLPGLMTMTPDDNFVADVMAATIEADRRRLHRRIPAFWETLVARPRFALEGAYLGAMAVFLLVGMPWSPFANVPEQVLHELRNQDGAVRIVLAESRTRITELGAATWSRAGQVVSGDFDVAAIVRPGVRSRLGAWGEQLGGWITAGWTRLIQPMIDWLVGLWADEPGLADSNLSDSRTPATPRSEQTDDNPTNDRSA